MGRNFVGALLAGATSGVIWMAIGLMTGMQTSMIGLGGLICLVGVLLISLAISTMVSRSHSAP